MTSALICLVASFGAAIYLRPTASAKRRID